MSDGDQFKFRLYVAGNGPNAVRALANLLALCQEHLPGRHEIEVVDVVREPRRALDDSIMLTPMLLKYSPGPACKITGSLSERETVLRALGLAT